MDIEKLFIYKIGSNDKIDDNLIKKICDEKNISVGILIIQRMSIRTEKRTYVIDGDYKIPVYSNRYGSKTKFR